MGVSNLTLSNHAPVAIEMELLSSSRPLIYWRLNKSLLQDTVTLSELTMELKHYFETNISSDSDPMTVWEVQKHVMRGILIKHGARLKCAREGEILRLATEIHILGITHKQSQAQATLSQLTALQEQLKTLALSKAKAKLVKCLIVEMTPTSVARC